MRKTKFIVLLGIIIIVSYPALSWADLFDKAFNPVTHIRESVKNFSPEKNIKALEKGWNTFKSSPGTITAFSTGDPLSASVTHNLFHAFSPNDLHPADGLLSGANTFDPVGYHSANFFSGSSGESVNFRGLCNYNTRFVVGSSMGAGYGAAAGNNFGPWGAVIGTAAGATAGGYMGTLSSEQAQRIDIDTNGAFPDLMNIHQCSWDIGHDYNFDSAAHHDFGRQMLYRWSGNYINVLTEPAKEKGIQQLEDIFGF